MTRLGAFYRGIQLSPSSTGFGSMDGQSCKSEKIIFKMWCLLHKSHFSEKKNSDFQLWPFVDPIPVELGESYIPL